MNLALPFNHRVLRIPKQRKGSASSAFPTQTQKPKCEWTFWPILNILACVGANGGVGFCLDIGENGAETQRTYLTLETVSRVEHKDQSEQM